MFSDLKEKKGGKEKRRSAQLSSRKGNGELMEIALSTKRVGCESPV